ncbi:MAG: hypothetical protein V7709_12335 [Halioglobus sp.]
MALLARDDIETQEVLDWRGLHLLHLSVPHAPRKSEYYWQVILCKGCTQRCGPGRAQRLNIPAFAMEAKAPFLQAIISNAIWFINTLRRKTLGDIAGV